MNFIKSLLRRIRFLSPLLDVLLIPISIVGATWFRALKYLGVNLFPITKSILFKVGVFPIVDHYYEPRFNFTNFMNLGPRDLPGIDFNEEEQLSMMDNFTYQEELDKFSLNPVQGVEYYYHNGSFPSGDSEVYYSLVRYLKPKRIIEVGSGFSTRMALAAREQNRNERLGSDTIITCIEPFEMPWLEGLEIDLVRDLVEDVELEKFMELEANDILFIDSSHIIRPGGDVLYEVLRVLPRLNKGVYIHFHDIFTPFEYPKKWLTEEFRLWNEQYLLEAFLSNNNSFKIVASMAFMNGKHREALNKVFPVFAREPKRTPGSIWIRKEV